MEEVSRRIKQLLSFIRRFVFVGLSILKSPRLATELIKAGIVALRTLGMRKLFVRLPMYFRIICTYAGYPATPGIQGTTSTIRMRPKAENSEVEPPAVLRMHPELDVPAEMLDVSLSIIIPARNAGGEFYWLLRKLNAQKGLRTAEIIVVDGGSTDSTLKYAKAANCHLAGIPQARFNFSSARNKGADIASGEYLLFLVQDAYPIGDYWAYGLVKFLVDHRDEKVVAVSCGDFCSSDSDVMADYENDVHSRFLRCQDWDRITELRAENHRSLRANGALNTATCVLPKTVFDSYRYRCDSNENLDLGVRLIKAGNRVAKLASVKTLRTQKRTAYSHLVTAFADVVCLEQQFEDYEYPRIDSVRGLVAGLVAVAKHLSDQQNLPGPSGFEQILDHTMIDMIDRVQTLPVDRVSAREIDLIEPALSGFLELLRRQFSSSEPVTLAEKTVGDAFTLAYAKRLESFRVYANNIYLQQDERLCAGLSDMLRKMLAATAGTYLGYLFLHYRGVQDENGVAVEQIRETLGVATR